MKHLPALAIAALIGAAPLAQADNLIVDRIQAEQSMQRPDRGTPMTQVRQQYGEPQEVVPAVGEPPITRWVYSDFVVYFEFDQVIHAVAAR